MDPRSGSNSFRSLPQSLFGVLKANWTQYQKCAAWDNAIKGALIPILALNHSKALERTFVPLPRLKKHVKQFGLDQDFGFITELDGLEDKDASTWMFLEHFGVGLDSNVFFWTSVLHSAGFDIPSSTMFEIYSHLQVFTADQPESLK